MMKLTSSIGLVNHRLDYASPCIDEPLMEKNKEKLNFVIFFTYQAHQRDLIDLSGVALFSAVR
jgi:hypothetical protein